MYAILIHRRSVLKDDEVFCIFAPFLVVTGQKIVCMCVYVYLIAHNRATRPCQTKLPMLQ